jgi:hypothetical protein
MPCRKGIFRRYRQQAASCSAPYGRRAFPKSRHRAGYAPQVLEHGDAEPRRTPYRRLASAFSSLRGGPNLGSASP